MRTEERDMQVYRLICEHETGITIDELCTIYERHFASHLCAHDDMLIVRDAIQESLSRLQSYLLIIERDGCYVSVSITEYMLKSQLKHAKPKSQGIPEIEIVDGVIRVQQTEQVQR